MRNLLLALCFVTVCYRSVYADTSATELVSDIYNSCLSQYSTSCVKPKALSWISHAVHQDRIRISDDLTIIRTSEEEAFTEARSANPIVNLFDKVDSFLTTHSMRVEVPQLLKNEEARSYLPDSFTKGGLAEGLQVPLVEGNAVEGRGFVKKVMIPFLLGLKFKTTVLVPLALALIAMKTWKAMTLGLLSLVMTLAMIIFKFSKPKIVNYEVVHYPHPHPIEHHVHSQHVHAPHVHGPPPHAHPIVFEPTPGWTREYDAQDLAYNSNL